MKKPWPIILGLMLLAAPIAVKAQFTYTTNIDHTISIVAYTGAGGAVTIPATINGLPVELIGEGAFSGSGVSSVMIPASVAGVYPFAFENCFNLTAITVDAQNQYLSSVNGVLFDKNQVTIFVYPAGMGGNYAIPSSVTSIAIAAFYSCSSLTNVTIPGSVTLIGEQAFQNCYALSSITIPNSVTSIGDDAFYGSGLRSVTISGGVTNIGPKVFGYCPNLTAITVNAQNLFYSSTNGVLFNKGQTTLLQYPGGRNGGYIIPGTVTTIGNEAFRATSLTGVTIPNSVTEIGTNAFYDCESLMNVTVPNGVTNIAEGAFSHSGLSSVTVAGSVTIIGEEAFLGCTSLTNANISNGVTSIGAYVFESCVNLASPTIPHSVTSIGEASFSGCTNLISVTIPGSVTNIGEFAFEGCTSLIGVYFDGNPPAADSTVFTGNGGNGHDNATVYYLPGTTGWSSPFGGVPAVLWSSSPPLPAEATAIIKNGFVVGVTFLDYGIGYSNTPLIYLVGGGGSGAQAIANVSNGIVTGITVTNAGFGYTNAPIVAITPPFPLMLGVGPAAYLTFTNLTVGTNYQLQLSQSGTWENLGSPFTASAGNYSQYVDGSGNPSLYRLAVLPLPTGATATAVLDNGFVVSATINNGGSGYVSVPGVSIIGGGGSGAQATATVSNGVVASIHISNAGSGYSSLPTVLIAMPPVPAFLPGAATAFRLDYNGLTPPLTYQLQVSSNLSVWTNSGTSFTATANTNSQYFNPGAGDQFFRLSMP